MSVLGHLYLNFKNMNVSGTKKKKKIPQVYELLSKADGAP